MADTTAVSARYRLNADARWRRLPRVDEVRAGSLHVVEDGTDDSANYAALHGLSADFMGHVLRQGMSQSGDGQGLQPDSAGAGERRQENSVAAEDHVLDAGHGRDLERDARLERAHVTGMDAQSFAGLKIAHYQFSGEFEPGGALSAGLLQQEAVAPENSRAQRLLEADADLNLRRGAEEAVAVNHVLVSRRDFHGDDVAGKLGREGELAGGADGAVFGHKDGAAAGHALEHAEQSSAAAELGVRGHLDRTTHPREFARFGDDGLIGFQGKFQDGHGGASDAALHGGSPYL